MSKPRITLAGRRRWIAQLTHQVGWGVTDLEVFIAEEFGGRRLVELTLDELWKIAKDLYHLRAFQQWRAGDRRVNPRALATAEAAGL